jgi:hypothetical protein
MAVLAGIAPVVSMFMVALPAVSHYVDMLFMTKCYRLILVLYSIERYHIRGLYRAAGIEGYGKEQGESNSKTQY